MKIIGITGGVGAGKSCVLAALKKMCNCDIVMADDVARQIMEKGGILTAKAYELFGEMHIMKTVHSIKNCCPVLYITIHQ